METTINGVERIVLTGGPSTGKTSVLEELGKRGFSVVHETARKVLEELGHASTKKGHLRRELLMFRIQDAYERSCEGKTFLDRSLVDYRAYTKYLVGEVPDTMLPVRRYNAVFLLDPLPFEDDGLRVESQNEGALLHDLLRDEYFSHDYETVRVPVFNGGSVQESVERRADFILGQL